MTMLFAPLASAVQPAAPVGPCIQWRPVVSFFAPGTPKAQPRPRAFARVVAGKAVARVFDSGSAEGWKGDVTIAAAPHRPPQPLTCPIRLDVDFLLPRTQDLLRKSSPAGELPHTKKPDRDNLEKSLLDALTALGFFHDDRQVCAGEVRKLYPAKDGRSGARVTISVPAGEGGVS